jgi:hypothetical protein
MLKTLTILAITFGLAYGEQSTAQADKHVDDGSSGAQQTNADKRGTPESPLVVNTHTLQTDAETAEEKRKNTEQEHTDRWIIGLTFAISICALLQVGGVFGQVYVYRQQTRLMLAGLKIGHKNAQAAIAAADAAKDSVAVAQKSAEAAERSVEAFINKERPYLTARPTFFYSTALSKGSRAQITLFLRNVGASNAKKAICYISVITTATQKHPPPSDWPNLSKFPSLIRPSGADDDPVEVHVPFEYQYDFSGFDWQNREPDPTQFVIEIAGVIRYQGVSEAREHELRFRYAFVNERVSIRPSYGGDRTLKWQPEGRFEKTGGPDDNRDI